MTTGPVAKKRGRKAMMDDFMRRTAIDVLKDGTEWTWLSAQRVLDSRDVKVPAMSIYDLLREAGFRKISRNKGRWVKIPDWKTEKTGRGFQVIEFKDSYGESCSLQQSSAIGDYTDSFDRPGSSYVWLGRNTEEPTRMHLNREQVQVLVKYLNRWLEKGGFDGSK